MRATVGEGEITVRDKDKQAELEAEGKTEDLAALNRDPDKAYEITKDKHVDVEFYFSDTSVKAAIAAGAAVTEIIGGALDHIREPELSQAIRNNEIDPATALQQLRSGNCGEQRGDAGFDLWEWIVPTAHAADCTLTTLSGKPVVIHDREGCFNALTLALYNQTVGASGNLESFSRGIAKGVASQGEQFAALVSDPAGMAKVISGVAMEIAYDPVAAAAKYGYAAADGLSEQSLLYLQALANGNYEAAGEYLSGLAIDLAIKVAAPAAGTAIGAIKAADKIKALEKIEKLANTGASNVNNAIRLKHQLIAEQITGGHGFQKHVLEQGEFAGLGIRTKQQYASHIENVLNNPSSVRYTSGGRIFYLQESTGTVVAYNPSAPDGGTAFQPRDWKDYISKLPTRTEPF